MNALEAAAARSRWARRNVGDKVLLCGGLLLAAISLPPWPAAALIIFAVAASAVAARVPAGLFLALWTTPAAFVAVGILPLLFSVSTDGLVWSPSGPQRAAEVVARATAAIGCTMLFTVTTPLSEVLAWAARSGIPRTLTHLAELIYRMIGTLAGTAKMMHEAQAQRLGHVTRRGLLTGVAAQSANLFVLSFQRARRLGEGLELRAEPGASDVLAVDRPRDGRFLSVALAVLVAVVAATALVRGWLP